MADNRAWLLRPRWWWKWALALGVPFFLVAISVVTFILLRALRVPFFKLEGQPSTDTVGLTWPLIMFSCFVGLFFSYILTSVFLITFRRFSYCRIIGPRTLEFKPLIGKWMSLRLNELQGYSVCSFPWWARQGDRGNGLALYHTNGSHIEFNDQHLVGLPEVKGHLESEGVAFLGDEVTWWYPIAKRRYKFDPKSTPSNP